MSPLEIILYSVIALAVLIYAIVCIRKWVKWHKAKKTGENIDETGTNAKDM